jgi:hypothetical protein
MNNQMPEPPWRRPRNQGAKKPNKLSPASYHATYSNQASRHPPLSKAVRRFLAAEGYQEGAGS